MDLRALRVPVVDCVHNAARSRDQRQQYRAADCVAQRRAGKYANHCGERCNDCLSFKRGACADRIVSPPDDQADDAARSRDQRR